MTTGLGISHSEMPTQSISTPHGVQLWIALPEAARNTAPGFEHYVPALTARDDDTTPLLAPPLPALRLKSRG